MAKAKRKSRTLVLGYLERIASSAFDKYPKQVTELIGKQQGVYALYKGDRLYYVGLASNLRNRIKYHLKDRHAGKWDRFSLYLVRKVDHIKELESLILRIADPKGNKTAGKLTLAKNLKKPLQAKIRRQMRIDLGDVMGTGATTSRRAPKTTSKKGGPTLKPYITKGFIIRATYKGKLYRAKVRGGGNINFNGTLYNSPSLAGHAVVKTRPVNGWTFWTYRNKKGEWVKLDELRK